ncbi:HNH endonuclease [Lactovum miscens]|uniref:Putative HNH nuclease YajD n=1 Tax=Lactovum miscens TaxID=190387 RepID=A0A841C5W4_9LACT|nr:HNH endonuclease [Lactovum miscens]MBB5887734.1 5-methylcytosine-specific restriction endonuclease McrA [Lactovum miscens]
MPMTGRCREPNCHNLVIRPLHYCNTHADKEVAYQESRQRWANQDNSKRYKDYDRKRNEDPLKSEQHKFYQTKQWKSLRRVAIARDNGLCQYCLSRGRVRTGKIVDHIVPYEIQPSNRSNLDNLAYCCSYCHKHKTEWEQIYYGTGFGNKHKDVVLVRKVSDIPDLKTP